MRKDLDEAVVEPMRDGVFGCHRLSARAAPARPQAAVSVLQVPEVCGWNPYVAAAEEALAGRGFVVLHPGLCVDNPGPAASVDLGVAERVRPDVVHLHWPEKLAQQWGTGPALRVLTRFKEDGARIVQTVHNIAPHEASGPLSAFTRRVDALTDGVHFFSPAHEGAARRVRPGLPGRVVYLPHPLLPAPPPWAAAARADPLTVGCFGRLRDYKRTVAFARTFLAKAPSDARLLIVGAPDNRETHAGIAELADADPRLDYRPGFVAEHAAFWRLLAEVTWVALPYARLHSSGVLVAALQAGRCILSPTPIGGTSMYARQALPAGWTTVDPWDDRRAVAAWTNTAALTAPFSSMPARMLALPTWAQAADRLADFYARLMPRTTPTGSAPGTHRHRVTPRRKANP